MRIYTLVDGQFNFWAVSFDEARRYIFRVPVNAQPCRWAPRLPDGSGGVVAPATPEEVECYIKAAADARA